MTPMTAERINDLRRRIVAGEQVPDEELIEALRYRMEQRASFSTRKKPETEPKPVKTLSSEDAQAAFDSLKL